MIARALTARAISLQYRHLPGEHEKTLTALVDELLTDPSPDTRLFAACLLHATPYGALLADAIGVELGRASVLRDPHSAVPLLDALRFLGGERHRPLVERLILAHGLPTSISAAASHHLGHVGERSNHSFWAQALSSHLNRWATTRSDSDAAVLRDLVYALGRARETRFLERLRLDTRFPSAARAAAAWWYAIPDTVYESANQ